MPCGAAQIDEASFCQEIKFPTIWENVLIELGFDVHFANTCVDVELIDLDFIIEVADVGDDGLVLHLRHMIQSDDIFISGGGHIDVGSAEGVFDGSDFKAFHGGLEGIDGVDFGDDYAGALASEGLGGAFAYVSVAANHGNFPRDHHIEGSV